jgi:mono/diheme cytochrome c family protein
MKLFLVSMFLLVGCARVNVDERQAYADNQKKIRHGIIPRDASVTPKKDADRIARKLDQASIERGKVIYRQHCLSCHGETGLGDGPMGDKETFAPANLRQTVKEVPDFDFFIAISEWEGSMPGWKRRFNDAELEDLKNYILTFR